MQKGTFAQLFPERMASLNFNGGILRTVDRFVQLTDWNTALIRTRVQENPPLSRPRLGLLSNLHKAVRLICRFSFADRSYIYETNSQKTLSYVIYHKLGIIYTWIILRM